MGKTEPQNLKWMNHCSLEWEQQEINKHTWTCQTWSQEEVPDSSSSMVVIHWHGISHLTTTGTSSVFMCERAGTVGAYGGLKHWSTSKQTLSTAAYILKRKLVSVFSYKIARVLFLRLEFCKNVYNFKTSQREIPSLWNEALHVQFM